MKPGYALSSEEHSPLDLVRYGALAEEAGFEFSLISDHFHPWGSHQPHASFVWNVLGALAVKTHKMPIGTGVTCPIGRIHPAIIAQAAATTAAMMPGRFFLGLGTGEDLNEHILGTRWPPLPLRMEMLEEAVSLLRELWEGKMTTRYGRFFTVEDARIFTLPEAPPPLALAASGDKAAALAGRIGDALISTAPEKEVIESFRKAGGQGKPAYGQVTVCWAASEAKGLQTALKIWPNGGLPSPCNQELRSVEHFDQAIESVTEEAMAKKVACGPDPEVHLQKIRQFLDAGFDHVYVHQIGPDQLGFFDFYQREVMPRLEKVAR